MLGNFFATPNRPRVSRDPIVAETRGIAFRAIRGHSRGWKSIIPVSVIGESECFQVSLVCVCVCVCVSPRPTYSPTASSTSSSLVFRNAATFICFECSRGAEHVPEFRTRGIRRSCCKHVLQFATVSRRKCRTVSSTRNVTFSRKSGNPSRSGDDSSFSVSRNAMKNCVARRTDERFS